MEIKATAVSVSAIEADALVIGAYREGDHINLTVSGEEVDAATQGKLRQFIVSGDFTAKPSESAVLYDLQGIKAPRLIVVGLGAASTVTEKVFLDAVAKAATATRARSLCFTSVEWLPEGRDEQWAARMTARSAFFAAQPAVTLKTGTPENTAVLQKVLLRSTQEKKAQKALEQGRDIAAAMIWSKHLADLPPNVCTPSFLARAAQDLAEHVEKISCKVLDKKQIEERKMGGLLAVSQGSREEPRFIELAWKGASKEQAPIVLVGKGVTFDAGGISLKPARGMDEMKYDMSGAAVVLGAVKAAAALQLPLNVTALVPTCENLPSGSAVKPADIITMSNGLTVEVLNTDAEGRLILADALVRAAQLNPQVTIDVATLTGACIVALGLEVSGLFCDDEQLTAQLAAAADSAFDAIWPLPMGGTYADQLKSPYADLQNIGNPPNAGVCTAATFLANFAPKGPWAHLDVAGPANKQGAARASTARPLPLLVEFLLERAAKA